MTRSALEVTNLIGSGPFVYQVADLAYHGCDPVALTADLGAAGVQGRLERHAE